MWNWITSNSGNILVALILIAVVAAITVYLVRQKKQGKSSCGAGCAHCALHGQCHGHHE